jgi:hypothetical protein
VRVTRITRHAAAHNRQRTQNEMQRRADHLLKILLVRDLVAEFGKCAECMNQFVLIFHIKSLQEVFR